MKKNVSKKYKRGNYIFLGAIGILVFLLFLFVAKGVSSAFAPDPQCIIPHQTSSQPPSTLTSAQDFFKQGNYDYDVGNCKKAIDDYTQAIQRNPRFEQAYNNRAYTYMRMRDYQHALPDLDRAIQLRPLYVNALMNRGDIYNFYYAIDRKKAMADYDTVLALGFPAYQGTSLCGHRLLAQSNGWNVNVFIKVLSNLANGGLNASCQ